MDETPGTVELTIESVVYRGKGLARLDGRVVFVPGVIAGERVRAEIVRRRKNYAEARLLEVLTPSPLRVEPACPLAQRPADDDQAPPRACPGCAYQHMAYAEELRCKQAQLLSHLEHTAHIDPSLCLPPVASPSDLGYRNKIMLHASETDGHPSLGYFAEDNTTVIDVPACPLAMAPLNALLAKLRADDAFLSSLGPLRAVTLRYTPKDGALFWTGEADRDARWLEEATTLGPVLAPPASFFQVNPQVADLLVEEVSRIVTARACKFAVDVYGGVGIFALAAAKAGVPHVLGIEHDPLAIGAARRNAKVLGLGQIDFICRPAKTLAQALRPLDPHKTVVTVDPPRRGLDARVLEAIEATPPATLVYVSCAADTLARDIVRLTASGYRLESARLFDMFPRTAYFETVAVLVHAPQA